MKTNPFHQTVIVTGGATEIGYAVAAQFVERGANVLLNGRTRAKLAGAAEKSIASLSSPPTSPSLPTHRLSSTPRSSASVAWMCW